MEVVPEGTNPLTNKQAKQVSLLAKKAPQNSESLVRKIYTTMQPLGYEFIKNNLK